jgi:hypothetical protein
MPHPTGNPNWPQQTIHEDAQTKQIPQQFPNILQPKPMLCPSFLG